MPAKPDELCQHRLDDVNVRSICAQRFSTALVANTAVPSAGRGTVVPPIRR
jgi:hypothetical protein